MSRSTPSLLALLGLVAVAGYQNRGRISEMLSDAHQKIATPGSDTPQGGGGFLSDIGQIFQGSPSGRSVSAALGDLVERFKAAGQSATADSWISDKANKPVGVDDLEAALGDDTLTELGQKTGLSRAELLMRLNMALPEVVNRFTPNGRLPTESEAQTLA
ncbi:MAG: YidB family protein [Cypionkella sp.]